MRLLLILGLSLIVLACGQRGPLYRPVPDYQPPPAGACATCPPLDMPAPEQPAAANAEQDKADKAKQPGAESSATADTTSTPTAPAQESTP